MQRMSRDIDISNRKVQETIELLSQQTSSEILLPEMEAEKNCKSLEMSEHFAECLAHETIEDAKLIVAVSLKDDIPTHAPEDEEVGNKASIMQWLSLSKHPDGWNEDNAQKSHSETLGSTVALDSNDISAEFLSKANDVLNALDNPDTSLPKEEADLLKSLLSYEMSDRMSMNSINETMLSKGATEEHQADCKIKEEKENPQEVADDGKVQTQDMPSFKTEEIIMEEKDKPHRKKKPKKIGASW